MLTGCKSGGEADLNDGFGITNPDITLPEDSGSGGGGSSSLLSIVSGNNQTVAVGGTAALPLVVLLIQAPGQPVANETVYFSVVGGNANGTLSVASAITNASGYAEVYFSGGTTIGTANVLAIAPQGNATFTMNVTGATGYNLDPTPVTSGDAQSGWVNTTILQPFRVILTDADGDPVPGQTVRFAATGATVGNFSGSLFVDTVTDASGLAQSTLLSLNTQAGVHTVNAFLIADSSVTTSFNATASVDPASAISPTLSTFTLSSGQVAADGFNTVDGTLVIKDQYGNLIPNNTYGATVVITPSPGLLGSSWLGSWTYTSTGTYKRTLLVGNTSGTINFGSQINSVNLLSGDPTLILTANSTVINANTTLDATVSPLTADGASTTTLVATLRDQFHNPIDLPGQTLVLSTTLGTLQGASMTYHAATGTYRQLLIAPTSTGGGSLTVTLQTINGVGVGGITKNILLQSSVFSAANSFLTITNRLFSGWTQTQSITIQLRDINNNPYTGAASVTVSKVLSQGGSVGVFGNSGNVTNMGNGVYQINLTSHNLAASCPAQPCTEDVSAVATVGATTLNLGPMRVHYRGAALTPAASGSYVKMLNTAGRAGNGSSVLVGTVYIRTSTNEQFQIGGMANRITLSYSGCNPPQYSILDNENGTYTVTIPSPPAGCVGTADFLFDGVRMTATPGDHTVNPVAFTFYGDISLFASGLSASPSTFSGAGTSTISLTLKDTNGVNIPDCGIATTSEIRFIENGNTSLNGTVSCSVIGGVATYQQIIERALAPEIDFESVLITAEYDDGSSWGAFSDTAPLNITPINLAGFTIDCNNNPYQDKSIYVDGGTLTINGWVDGSVPTTAFCSPGNPLRFKKLRIGPTGILTHSAATTINAYGIDVQFTESVEVLPGGKIDVSGKGYLGGLSPNGSGYGPGNIASVTGAAAYGGTVVSTNSYCLGTNTGYGLSADPNYPGSGGKTFSAPGLYQGGNGGGLVRIKAASFILNGSILADAVFPGGAIGCGGSGGGIKLDLETAPGVYGPLTGSGAISSIGSDGYTINEGSGGRIAILGDMTGYTGIYPNARWGTLVNANTTGGGSLYFARSPYTNTIPHHMIFGGTTGSYFGPSTPAILPDVSIPAATNVYLIGSVNWGDVSHTGAISFGPSGSMNVDNIIFQLGSSATHDALTLANYAGQPRVSVTAVGTIEIKSGVSINVDGKGYPAGGSTHGIIPAECGIGFGFTCKSLRNNPLKTIPNNVMEGGAHYRKGGGFIGTSWGDLATANTYGGGGASWSATTPAGTGGGIIRLIADTIIMNGNLSANGVTTSYTHGAGGAGGSIFLSSDNLENTSGISTINANGGNAGASVATVYVGGGSGGIIRIERNTQTGTFTTSVTNGLSYKDAALDVDPARQAEPGDVIYTTP